MKIAVMGGTPVDSRLGKELLEKHGFVDILSVPISNNPIEQTTFQSSSSEYRMAFMREKVEELRAEYDAIFVYCNSLSSVVDFDQLSQEYEMPMITPMQMYRQLAMDYQQVAVMAANSHGLMGVENNLYKANPSLQVIGITLLELVKSIEANLSSKEIATKFDFSSLISFFNGSNVEAVILGCTHFPYIKEELESLTKLPIIDVGEYMVRTLKKNLL